MIGSGCAFLAASANRISFSMSKNRKEGEEEENEEEKEEAAKKLKKMRAGVSLAVSVFVSIGSFGEVIGLHLVPDADEHSNVSTLRNISDYVELMATTCGIVTSLGAFVGGEGLKVAVAAGTCDSILTTISVFGGALVPSPFLTTRHVHYNTTPHCRSKGIRYGYGSRS